MSQAGALGASGGGSGDVTGPASSTDNAITRFDGTTGKIVQNSGVTLDDNNNISNTQNFVFDTSPASPGTAEGTIYWDATDNTMALKNDVSDVTLQIGQENLIRVRNESGTTISNGKIVYITGTEAGGESRPLVDLAQADNATTSAAIGAATHDISNNAYGYVTAFGLIRDLNTSAFTEGDLIYLSEVSAGDFTATQPVSPNISKAVGYIVVSDAAVGTVLFGVTPQTAQPTGDAAELTVVARKDSAGTINDGEVVYQSGYSAGSGAILVELADADDPTTMPAIGIARGSFTNSSSGTVVISGLLTGQDTSAFSVGDQLYVDTTAGALTNVRPTAANTSVQKIGIVARSNPTNGTINISGAGRSNDIPNIMPDNYFRIVDDGDNTRVIQFQASGITASNTRTITMADQDIDLTPSTGSFAASSGGGVPWTTATGATQAMTADNGYIPNNGAGVAFSLPASAAVGSVLRIAGRDAGGWSITQGAGQQIHLGDSSTTAGAGGSLASTNRYDAIYLVCIVANTEWVAASVVGNITVV